MRALLLFSILSIGGWTYAQSTIAVLPYSINYQGNIPKKYTPEQVEAFRSQESGSYQASMVNYLSRQLRKRAYRDQDLAVLSAAQTEALLLQHQLTPAALDSLSNERIATILGVTHVVRGTVNRTFIMSDELSMGITAAAVLTGQPVGMMNTTSMLEVINSLETVPGSAIVFSRQYTRRTTATQSDERSVRDTFRKSSRKMVKRLV